MKRQMSFEGRIVSVRKSEQVSVIEKGGDAGQMMSKEDVLNFYWEKGDKKIWLFSQKYTQGVHEKFRNGLRDFDIRNFDKWKRNPRMDKTIDKIPVYVAYAEREIA